MFDVAGRLSGTRFAWLTTCSAMCIAYGAFCGLYVAANNTPQRIFFFIAFIFMLLIFLGDGRARALLRSRLFVASILLTFYFFLSTAWDETASASKVSLYGRRFVMFAMFLIVTAALIASCRAVFTTVPLTMSVFAIVAVPVAIVVFYVIGGYEFPSARLYSIGRSRNPLDVAPSYGMLLLWLLVLFGEGRLRERWQMWLGGAGMAASMIFLFLSQSRGTLAGIAASLFALVILKRNTRIAGLIVIGALGVAMLAMPSVTKLIFERGLSDRPDIWVVAADALLQKPWFGWGVSTDLRFPAREIFYHPHNVFLGALIYGGVVGFVLLVWLLAEFALLAWRQYRDEGSALPIVLMVAAMTFAMVDISVLLTSIDRVWFAIWVPVAMAIAYDIRSAPAILMAGEAGGSGAAAAISGDKR